ncbi:MAG: DASH family cryptochrome, partial [Oleiphilaceae bacterium]|nr:DASH family cryptochrome [Oleiphilaceae bacterium]
GLTEAARADLLLCVFVVDPRWFRPGKFQSRPMGPHRWRFLWQSLMALDAQLQMLGNRLHIAYGPQETAITALCKGYDISHLHRARLPGTQEADCWGYIESELPGVEMRRHEILSLFKEQDLPFELPELPDTFSQFRRRIEASKLVPAAPLAIPKTLPPAPGFPEDAREQCPPRQETTEDVGFSGGEAAAAAHLEAYLFEHRRIVTYKETRNALDDWPSSAKLSPWLANGSLSPRFAADQISRFERKHVRNESTYWLYFELLWREYFYWYGLRHGKRLFQRNGVQQNNRPVSFYPHRFRAWCDGQTGYPLVNACMNQLRETGYMSNRGRQLVASCFVNELELDWRYGAAWFEEQLVDYDVASNYGNWQYLAGVGADPRGLRRFNLTKQQTQYDPDGEFVRRWRGESSQPVPLHTVDAADWPIG